MKLRARSQMHVECALASWSAERQLRFCARASANASAKAVVLTAGERPKRSWRSALQNASARIDRRKHAGAFTLAEVLAALAFMAIVIPVAVNGLRVANRAGQV